MKQVVILDAGFAARLQCNPRWLERLGKGVRVRRTGIVRAPSRQEDRA
jgi:hypothetical protein